MKYTLTYTLKARLVWQNPYVTDGLISQWDAEWNKKGIIHDASADHWDDLASGLSMQVNGSLWGDRALTANGTTQFTIPLPEGFIDLANAGTLTLEFCGSYDVTCYQALGIYGSQKYVCAICQGKYGQDGTAGLHYISLLYAFNAGNLIMRTIYATKNDDETYSVKDKPIQFAFALDGTSFLPYVNGSAIKTKQAMQVTYNKTCTLICNLRKGGWINAIRLYNRALTKDEIAANAAVDQARFLT